ncbi:MAG: hypothetical protein LBS68_01130 [Puniceicoccales bacterium]|jgi:hypothetical protein|nr:hypothetical protein [Puniceicoccales bacterium]
MWFTVPAFDRGKFGGVAGKQFENYIASKRINPESFGGAEATQKQFVEHVETAFFNVGGASTLLGLIEYFFSYCAGFIVRMFASNKKLELQFSQKWLQADGYGHECVKHAVSYAECMTRPENLMDAIDNAIGPDGRFSVTYNHNGSVIPLHRLGSGERECIVSALSSGAIGIEGDNDSEKLKSLFNGAFFGIEGFSVVEKQPAPSDQAPSQEALDGDTATPTVDATKDQDLLELMESTVAITGGLSKKARQARVIQALVCPQFEFLMKDKNVQSAVYALHSRFSGTEKLVGSMEDKEEFRRAFLWNVTHATVKACFRQQTIADKSVKFNFPKFLQSGSSRVKHLVFKGILKSDSPGADADSFLQMSLAAAFNAIGTATTYAITPNFIGESIMNEIEAFRSSIIQSTGLSLYAYRKLDAILQDSKNKVFERLIRRVISSIPSTLAAIPEWSAPNAPDKLVDDGRSVAARFTNTVENTPFEGLFSVGMDAPEDDVNKCLKLMSDAYVYLQNRVKKIAKLDGTEICSVKLKDPLESHQIFSEADAEQLRKIRNRGKT